ncbi:MAG: ATP-binding cassette domain-containing protein [Dermatophilaceae bacterium]
MHWRVPENGRTLLLGRNGAGKTTTLRLLAGGLRQRAGRIRIDGVVASRSVLRRSIALMPQTITAVPGLTVFEQVSFAGWLAGLAESNSRAAARLALKEVNLEHLSKRKPATLSGGELRRVGLAEALVRPANWLLLDEPTAGLDPVQRADFRALLLALDRPTLVSTHQLDDVDDLFTYVAILEDGRIIFQGTVGDYLSNGTGPNNARRAESAFSVLTRRR